MARTVTHDLNNHLATILGYAELLLLRLDPGSPLRREVEEIKQAAQQAADLTRGMIELERQSR